MDIFYTVCLVIPPPSPAGGWSWPHVQGLDAGGLSKTPAAYILEPLAATATAPFRPVPPTRWVQAKLLAVPMSVSLVTNMSLVDELTLVALKVAIDP